MSEICSLGVTVRQNKAYIESEAITKDGWRLIIEPIYTVDLSASEMAKAMEKVYRAGNPRIPTPTPEEMKKRPDPLLKAAKVGSWKKLAQGGVTYYVSWYTEEVIIGMSDDRGRFDWDSDRKRKLPPDTPMQDIAQIILDDARSRPYVETSA